VAVRRLYTLPYRKKGGAVTAVLSIGQELPTAIFKLKYNSQQDFSLFFWDDAAATIPSNLASTVVTLEIDQPTASGTVFTGVVQGATNEVKFSVTAAQSTVTWSKANFRVVYVVSSKRYVILSGEVRVQR
jgi:hypothetical protein